MSGPIVPPLEVTEVDGNPSGRPITKIIVSNGDLSISGRTATIDTSGSGGTPGGSDTQVQFNDSGSFGGDAGLTYNKTTNVLTVTDGAVAANLNLGDAGANSIRATNLNGDIFIDPEGTGGVFLEGNNDGGGTVSNLSLYLIKAATTDYAEIQLQNKAGTDQLTMTQISGGDFQISNLSDTSDIDIITTGTGQVEVQNATTDTDSVLSIMGNGTGDPKIDLQNASNRVWVLCDANKKLKIQGGSGGNTWIFDASSASGGVTFPDGTEQTTAATGGGDGMLFCAAPPASGYDYDLSGQSQGSQASNVSMSADTLYMMPFSVPAAISAAELTFGIASGTFSGTFYVAIYSADSDNLPDSREDSASASISTTGDKTLTFSSAVSLSADTLYYACISWDGGSGSCNYAGGYYEYGRSGLPVDNTTAISTNSGGVITYSASGTPPATITTASLTTGVRGGPKIRLGV